MKTRPTEYAGGFGFALLSILLLFALVGAPGCSHSAGPDLSRTPVIFVHGHGMSPDDWDSMIRRLSKAGYPLEYLLAVEIRPNVMGNVRAAETVIAPAVERLLKQAQEKARASGYSGSLPRKVDIVSHSMGAVSSRWYAARMSPERVRTWISLGGANHGTNVLCKYEDDGAADLCPAFATNRRRNPVQVSLNGTREDPIDETPWGPGADAEGRPSLAPDEQRRIHWFTIRIDPDAWIEPAHSAMIDGGSLSVSVPDSRHFRETSPGNFLMLTSVIHDDMPWDSDVIALVETLLSQDYGGEY